MLYLSFILFLSLSLSHRFLKVKERHNKQYLNQYKMLTNLVSNQQFYEIIEDHISHIYHLIMKYTLLLKLFF